MTRAAVALVLGFVSSCGNGSKQPAKQVAAEAGVAASTEAWTIVEVRDPYVLATRAKHVAILDHAGKIVGEPAMAVDALTGAVIVHDVLVWADGTVVHAFDLASGRERWHVDVAHEPKQLIAGDATVAVTHPAGVEVLQLADGTSAFHVTGPANAGAVFRDGVYYVADANGGLAALQEATKKQLWTASFGNVNNFAPQLAHEPNKLLVVNGKDGPFAEFDLATGKSVASGRGSPNAPGDRPVNLGRGVDGDHYQATGASPSARTTFALDVANRVKWSATGWPVDAIGYDAEHDTVAVTDGDHAAIVLAPMQAPRILVGFDNKTGKLGFTHPLAPTDQLIDVKGACVLLLELGHGHKLSCFDVTSGAATWSHALFGPDAKAWPGPNGDTLVADSTPAALSRLDAAGKTMWKVTLPDTDFDRGWGWVVGATVAAKAGVGAQVIDLATGKVAAAHP